MSIKDTLISLQKAISDPAAFSHASPKTPEQRVDFELQIEKVRILQERFTKLINITAKQELREAGILKQVDAAAHRQREAEGIEFDRKLSKYLDHIRSCGANPVQLGELRFRYDRNPEEFEATYADFVDRRDRSIPLSAFGGAIAPTDAGGVGAEKRS